MHKDVRAAEMINILNQKSRTPHGYDHQVYEGVQIGMRAMKMKNKHKMTESSTVFLPIDRVDQRVLKLPDTLGDDRAPFTTVVLNGNPCVAGQDYEISGNVLNWVSQRKLRPTDGLAMRYPLQPVPHIKTSLKAPDIKVTEKPKSDWQIRVWREVEKPKDSYVDPWAGAIPVNPHTFEPLVKLQAEEPEVDEELEEYFETEQENADMIPIEEGSKVWHRMTDEGPWIVIQRSTLKIRSSLAGGNNESVYKDSFCETAWTVQTEDQGMVDFPEVVLTTKPPRDEPKKMALWKKVLLGAGATGLAFGVIQWQWIYHMIQPYMSHLGQ